MRFAVDFYNGLSAMKRAFFIFIIFMVLAGFASPARGFYELQGKDSYLSVRGMARIYGNTYRTPENNVLYQDRTKTGLAGLGRIIIEAGAGDNFYAEFNAYQTYIPYHMVYMQAGLGTALDVERSSGAEWSMNSRRYAHAAIDRLNFRWSMNRMDLTVGRQPVNLATTFFFSPNDFFAPFAAQAFYRHYKPGVDAARAEIRLNNFSQLSLITVIGYEPDLSDITGWSKSPSSGRNSYIARVSSVFNKFELGFITGTIRGETVLGGSIQGEIFRYIGVRAEGNILYPEKRTEKPRRAFSIGFDRHFANSLDLRMEYFYNGVGSNNPSEYMGMFMNSRDSLSYFGRNYAAAGAGYEFTPLFRGDMSFIINLGDRSALCSFYGVYSLTNETDLSFNIGIPLGKTPKGMSVESEFGMYPYSVTLEIRHFF